MANIVDATGNHARAAARVGGAVTRRTETEPTAVWSSLADLLRYVHRPTQDLAGGALGQRLDQPDLPWVLVRGDPGLHELPQLVGLGAHARLQRDRGDDFLAE